MHLDQGGTTGPPALQPSDEANAEQLQLGRAQGAALQQAVANMIGQTAHDGREQWAGDYRVGYAVEAAEGTYQWRDGRLVWVEPEDENVHLEIVVRDGADGHFIPGLTVYATLRDRAGQEIGTHHQPFLWHPWLYHYGRNWRVPGTGAYTLQIRIDAPDFPRHDKVNGQRYTTPVVVEFTTVQIQTSRK